MVRFCGVWRMPCVLRSLLRLRSPLNTAARLLNPFDARTGVDWVFHPAYIALHLATAERLGRERLAVTDRPIRPP
jgi:anthranilate phosphoribosyltransferase